MMRLLVVTDAWQPQINGVVRTLERTIEELDKMGVQTTVLSPADFRTLPCPTYPEIRLSLTTPVKIRRIIERIKPDAVHIATEGPLGMLARRHCMRTHRRFTTSYHTRFPEYLAARAPVPLRMSYAWMRRFHNAASGCMVATDSLEADLASRGFRHLMRWSRGVDHKLFNPDYPRVLDLPRPIFGYVGRVAVEKNIEAFLALDLPGSKVVVGGGPALEDMRRRFPDVHFTGPKVGEALAAHYCSLDVFVFPSLTDTFGNVLIEALSAGVPVAAFPVMGPVDVISNSGTGVLDNDLAAAAKAALSIPRDRCREYALRFSWEASARQFLDNLIEAMGEESARLPVRVAAE
ncbi:glycosyltransferase family 4 protein [Segnochrobactrum spirostomi]|uniref:Glycosyltransferase family 1 protein n=1 Tax=Segnochrobactrum spirostomi TaxID=2608987 RepID=A0A6A7XYW8_9HYPH|nr:glycosyltransferase family 1 protein [Segnochrobactrum spirostomi]MQT11111.1 glycosyltransferase family 1 protein [Segnochrobactrum spirostomi]